MKLDDEIKDIEEKLIKKEEKLDEIIRKEREIVRMCSKAITFIHTQRFREADVLIKKAKEGITRLKKKDWRGRLKHMESEYTEARILYGIIMEKKIAGRKNLGVSEEAYLLGLLDVIGELKREMYEMLRKGNKKKAKEIFSIMERIYDALIGLRFSGALLPELRRKQDVARIQLEQARGEII